MFTSIYTFITYFEHTTFLYGIGNDVAFHGSFFAGVAGALLHMVGAFALFIDDDISKADENGDDSDDLTTKKIKSPGYYRSAPQVNASFCLSICNLFD